MNRALWSSVPYFIITGVSLVIIAFIFGDAFWHPNTYTFMTGGDGNVIYYNMIYHTLYGHGLFLENMNFTEPECIFMTDAQGVISLILSNLKNIIPGIQTHVIGIVHVLIMLAIWLQFILLYKINRKLDVPTYAAILFALGIGLLAPQLVRISYGHLGLAYPFIIPMTILWLLDSKNHRLLNWRTILFLLVALFFGFNNPYLLVIISILLISYGIVAMLTSKSIAKHIMPLGLGITLLIILYITTALINPYNDRIQNQWGSFYFASTIEDLLWGKYSLQNSILGYFNLVYEGRSESRASISLMSLLILILGFIYYSNRAIRRKTWNWSHPLSILTFASILSFIYASSLFKSKWWQWITEDLGFITMVKASGRLSWINYYVWSLLAVFIIMNLSKYYKQNKWIQSGILILGLIWCGEGYYYLKDHIRPNLYPNQFSGENLDKFMAPKKEVIDFSRYQAILSIPIMQSWNDNLMNSSDWATELTTFSISASTGLPIVGAKLSRAPVARSLANLQITANPLITKEIIQDLDPSIPLLLVKTCNIQLTTIGEEWLVEQGTIIYQDKNIDIFELWPVALDNTKYVEESIQGCSIQDAWHYYQGFEDEDETGKVGRGKLTNESWAEVEQIIVSDSVNGLYELSIWSFVNIDKHGMPAFEIWLFDKHGTQRYYQYLDARNYVDNQDGWLKMHHNVQLQSNYKLYLKARSRYPMMVDELLLRPLNGIPTCIDIGNDEISLNNIIISKS